MFTKLGTRHGAGRGWRWRSDVRHLRGRIGLEAVTRRGRRGRCLGVNDLIVLAGRGQELRCKAGRRPGGATLGDGIPRMFGTYRQVAVGFGVTRSFSVTVTVELKNALPLRARFSIRRRRHQLSGDGPCVVGSGVPAESWPQRSPSRPTSDGLHRPTGSSCPAPSGSCRQVVEGA